MSASYPNPFIIAKNGFLPLYVHACLLPLYGVPDFPAAFPMNTPACLLTIPFPSPLLHYFWIACLLPLCMPTSPPVPANTFPTPTNLIVDFVKDHVALLPSFLFLLLFYCTRHQNVIFCNPSAFCLEMTHYLNEFVFF